MIFLAKKFVLSMIIRTFAATESATLPIRTANQGGSFAFYGYIKKALSIIHSAISVRILEEVHQPCFILPSNLPIPFPYHPVLSPVLLPCAYQP